MKFSTIDIELNEIKENIFKVLFLRNGQSFFGMEAKITPDDFSNYIAVIERFITTEYGCEFRMNLKPSGGGSSVKLAFKNTFMDEDISFEDVRGFYTNLIISYPTYRRGGEYYNDRKVYSLTLDFVKAFYLAIILIRPELKSELIEAIIDMNDLESFYERIA